MRQYNLQIILVMVMVLTKKILALHKQSSLLLQSISEEDEKSFVTFAPKNRT